MSRTLSCDDVARESLAERYLAARLAPAAEAEFEEHYLTCAACQFSLRLGAAIRSAVSEPVHPARRGWPRLLGGTAVLAAAALAAVLLLPRDRPPGELRGLGGLSQAPVYLGVPVRPGEPTAADSLFSLAMDDYGSERWAAAAEGLRAALAAGVDPAAAEFFLGASLLMLDRPQPSADAFGRVVALDESPYVDEAHFYRAKALLRLGRSAEAAGELAHVADRATVVGAYARALADSLREVVPR